MQLILDSETSVDIKRNMSTLNEEALTEKLDIIQDLKSGICNGNKENIQSNDNTTSTTEDKPLESEKSEVDFVSDSQTLADEGKEETLNKEVNGKSAKDNEEENINSEDKTEINEETSTISEDPKLSETVSNFNDTEKLNKSEHVEENLKTDERSNGHEGLESQHDIEPTERHQILVSEQINEEDGKVKVTEKDESATKIDKIATEKIDEIVTETVDEIVTEKVDKIENEKVDEIENEKVDEIISERVDLIVSEKVDKSETFEEIIENFENCNRKDQRNELKGKEEDNLKAPDADELSVQGLEKVDVDQFKNSDENYKVDQNSDTAIISNSLPSSPQKDLVSSPTKTDSEEGPSLLPQMSNDQATEELPNKEDNITTNKQSNTDEIETVDLDDEEKETEILQTDTDIVNIEGEINGQIKANSNSDCLNANRANQVPEMETVDLDDEKDVSETEPMDVDINGETGEVDVKVLPVPTSSENLTDLTLCSDDNLDEVLSTLKKTESSVRPMDEDSHTMEIDSKNKSIDSITKGNEEPINLLDDGIDELKEASEPVKEVTTSDSSQTKDTEELKAVPTVLKLSNTLDILSDDEDEIKAPDLTEPQSQSQTNEGKDTDKKCINLDDDDDIMLIDEVDEASDKYSQSKPEVQSEIKEAEPKVETEVKETTIKVKSPQTISEEAEKIADNEKNKAEKMVVPDDEQDKVDKKDKTSTEVKTELSKPLVPNDFLKTCKKNMAEMTRDDLEEFCILKIVESVVDRSSLSEIKTRLKGMAQSIEEYKKKSMMLTKQNRDLQVVLKTIQEEQKNSKTVTPLKITRSVGMQVLMTERTTVRRKPGTGNPAASVNNNTTPTKSPRATNQRPFKVAAAPTPQQIPVPRLIPASTSPATKNNMQQLNNTGKSSPVNGVRMTPQKAEKRPVTRNHSVTVDLTDDEPPAKVNRNSAPTPGRVAAPHLSSQNLMTSTPRIPGGQNNPRKVYIPISGPQNPQNVRPGQAIMLKSVSTPNARPRLPQTNMTRMPQNQIRMSRVNSRHPAPLPESNKIYPGNFMKALPPAPDLKLSKVENGIVISWKIEGYQEDSFEEIASYQLYAYQETSAPPSTNLWKKIGDVKALPLPMACTLTQFMAGFKYYFAVRAVDIRSRIGPFSLPGSILLLNKL